MTATVDTTPPQRLPAKGYLHGPVVDFICLGGGSLPILCALFLLPGAQWMPYLAATLLLLSHVVNNPHFMHSYQIFYEGFRGKIARGALLRSRYLVAGVGVPVCLLIFFAYCVATRDARLMGLSMNLMLFTVGWHYVKQGYGILIVESVLKKAFLTAREKDWLRWNALSIWMVSWMMGNRAIFETQFYGLQVATFDIPDPIYWAVLAISAAMGAVTVLGLARKSLTGPVPVNGVLAYVTSAYVWLVLAQIDPLMLSAVPLFHSMQYLAVVWRYRLNKEHAGEPGMTRLLGLFEMTLGTARMVRFVWFGIMLGALWFWAVPLMLDATVAYDKVVFGDTMFVFMVVVFVNVHHYFLDNVMWRRENADVKEHLFS